MKNILLFTILVFSFATVKAQTTDYLQKKEFQTEKKKIYDNIDAAKKPSSELKKLVTRQSLEIDSLNAVVKAFGTQNKSFADSINKMSVTVASLNLDVANMRQKTWKSLIQVIIMLGIIALLGIISFFVFWRKTKKNFATVGDYAQTLNDKINKESSAMRVEVIEGIAKMHAVADALGQKLSARFDQFEAEHGQVHRNIQDNTLSLKDEIETIKESSEEKIKTVKSDLASKTNELLSQTNALKIEMDKEIQMLLSEVKKAKAN